MDDSLPVGERLEHVKTLLGRPSAGTVVTYDIIQVYKKLVLSCSISLEGNCEDPKVGVQYCRGTIFLLKKKKSYKNVILGGGTNK